MRSWITRTHTEFSFALILALVLGGALGCDVYDGSLLNDTDTGTGCPMGTADCDGNGSCESDLTSEATCGSCVVRCVSGERCVAGTACVPAGVDAGDVGPPPDASGDANIDAPDSGPPVIGRRPPPRPPASTEGDDTSARVWALKDVVLDQSGDIWRTIGWNLDEVETESIMDFHPCTPPDAPVPPLDGIAGTDNAFGKSILSQIIMFNSAFEANAREEMEEGEAILVSLRGWNGEDDDPQVEVTMIQALGVNRADGEPLPQWDGDDRWIQADTSFVGGNPDVPQIFNDNAYVADRMIVFQLPDRRPITLPWVDSNRFDLFLIDAMLTGTISEDGQRLEQVWLTGRYPTVELNMAWEIAGLCEGTASRAIIDMLLASELDIRDPVGSGTGPSVTCNAISLALELTGYLADLDAIASPPDPQPVDCLP